MNEHDIDDDTLVLYYYRDGLGAAERRRVGRALQRDPALAHRFTRLCRDLETLQPADDPDEAPAGLEHRLRVTVQRAARLERDAAETPRRGWHPWSFALGSAATAALAVALGLGLWSLREAPLDPAPITVAQAPAPTAATGSVPASTPASIPAPADWSRAAFRRGLQAHFRESRVDLRGLEAGAGDGKRAMIDALVEQNRVYARLAVEHDALDLARVLRSFEPVLLRLATEDLDTDEAEALRDRLEFELGVMLTKLARQASDQPEPQTQEPLS